MDGQQNLKGKAVSSAIWAAVQKYTVFIITFISDIILARLLSPYDFGCIGILLVFTLLAETIIDGGFGSALIQKKRPTQEDYSTIFFWNMSMSLVLYGVLFLSAPFIASYYKIPELSILLKIQGLILFAYSFNIVQWNQLKKKLDFKTLAIITVICQIVAFVVALVMAYSGFGVWALVAKNLISAVLSSMLLWFVVKWRPLLVFSWTSFKSLFSFGFFMFLSSIVTTISTRIQDLLIGKVYGASDLGYFTKASGAQHMATTSLSQVLEQITLPIYVEAQDNLPVLQNMVKRMTVTLAYISFPLVFILMLVAKPFFVILYSEKWLISVPYFQVLCIAGMAQCLQSVNLQTINAIGRGDVSLRWTLIKRIMGIGFVVGGLALWGMKGIILGVIINAWFAYFVNMALVSKYVGYKWDKQLLDLLPVTLASVAAALISYFAISYFNLNMYIDGLLKLVLYLVIYLSWSLIFKPDASEYFKTILIPLVKKMLEKFHLCKKMASNELDNRE